MASNAFHTFAVRLEGGKDVLASKRGSLGVRRSAFGAWLRSGAGRVSPVRGPRAPPAAAGADVGGPLPPLRARRLGPRAAGLRLHRLQAARAPRLRAARGRGLLPGRGPPQQPHLAVHRPHPQRQPARGPRLHRQEV